MANTTDQNIEQEVIAKAARALSEQTDLEVTFAPAPAKLTDGHLQLPLPSQEPAIRGIADRMALLASQHDANLHAETSPASGGEVKNLFDTFEYVRTEALGAKTLGGVKRNLADAAAREWQRHPTPDAPEAIMPLLLRSEIAGLPVPSGAKAAVKALKDSLPDAVFTDFKILKTKLNNQSAYAQQVKELMVHFGLDDTIEPSTSNEDDDDQDETPDQQDEQEDQETQDETPDDTSQPDTAMDENSQSDVTDMRESDAPPPDNAEQSDVPMQPDWLDVAMPDSTYRVFTNAYDEVIRAEDLSDPDELDRLRHYLDQQSRKLDPLVSKLANRLSRRLIAQQRQSWMFDLEEGMLDTARLTRVITDPTAPLSFKQETDMNIRNTVVTLLLDNSGSMRGRPIMMAALCADMVAQTLERCGVKCEILGYTTRTWKGGLSREAWMKAGKPAEPGRLNDLRHIIYKNADTPLRRARKHLGLMMREGLLKENIDGEALAWAASRLFRRPEDRRILMVVSDGAPVDDSTLSTNPANILESHLRSVIQFLQDKSDLELTAIGIGHDVGRYYKNAVTIADVETLGETLIKRLEHVFLPAN